MAPKLLLIVAAATSAFAQGALVNNVGNFVHDVADLERSVHFYRDVLGMDQPRPIGHAKAASGGVRPRDPGNAAVQRLAATDIDTSVETLRQAPVKVISVGGAIQTLPPGALRAPNLRAPDDLLIQVVH